MKDKVKELLNSDTNKEKKPIMITTSKTSGTQLRNKSMTLVEMEELRYRLKAQNIYPMQLQQKIPQILERNEHKSTREF
jgi:hypothetical protein